MDVLADYILNNASNPVEMAVHFLLFILILDSIINLINNLVNVAGR